MTQPDPPRTLSDLPLIEQVAELERKWERGHSAASPLFRDLVAVAKQACDREALLRTAANAVAHSIELDCGVGSGYLALPTPVREEFAGYARRLRNAGAKP